MPMIKGLNAFKYRKIPMMLLRSHEFRYAKTRGILAHTNESRHRADIDAEVDGSRTYSLIQEWSSLYKIDTYIGYEDGEFSENRYPNNRRMVLDEEPIEFTRDEFIKYKDKLFYSDADFDKAMEIMGW